VLDLLAGAAARRCAQFTQTEYSARIGFFHRVCVGTACDEELLVDVLSSVVSRVATFLRLRGSCVCRSLLARSLVVECGASVLSCVVVCVECVHVVKMACVSSFGERVPFFLCYDRNQPRFQT
jgi:hypothetical protein